MTPTQQEVEGIYVLLRAESPLVKTDSCFLVPLADFETHFLRDRKQANTFRLRKGLDNRKLPLIMHRQSRWSELSKPLPRVAGIYRCVLSCELLELLETDG
jgi:hypothetical protein